MTPPTVEEQVAELTNRELINQVVMFLSDFPPGGTSSFSRAINKALARELSNRFSSSELLP